MKPAGVTQAPEIHRSRFQAMGSHWELYVTAADYSEATADLNAAWAIIKLVEQRLSRFRPDSELSRLNASQGKPFHASPLLWAALKKALAEARRTDGIFDPTILDALEAAGYDRSFERLANGDATPAVVPHTVPFGGHGWQEVALDDETRSVTLPAGLRIDFGGIAKAWAGEWAAETLARSGACLVDAGGDVVAVGAPPGRRGWPVGVADPSHPDVNVTVLELRDRAVATSGTDYRRWEKGGVPQHHIIDPRTRRPAETDVVSATVVGRELTYAAVAAKVAIVLGSAEGRAYLERQQGAEALLVLGDGATLTTAGFGQYVFDL